MPPAPTTYLITRAPPPPPPFSCHFFGGSSSSSRHGRQFHSVSGPATVPFRSPQCTAAECSVDKSSFHSEFPNYPLPTPRKTTLHPTPYHPSPYQKGTPSQYNLICTIQGATSQSSSSLSSWLPASGTFYYFSLCQIVSQLLS